MVIDKLISIELANMTYFIVKLIEGNAGIQLHLKICSTVHAEFKYSLTFQS